MSTMTKLHGKIEQIALACILLVSGVLLCVKLSTDTLSIIIGALLVAYGVLTLGFLVLKRKPIASKTGYFSCLVIAIGIMMIAENTLSVFVYMLPYVLIVIGVVLFADAFLGKYQRLDGNLVLFVVKLSLGTALIAFSICLLTINSLSDVTPIAFGALLILASAVLFMNLFAFKKPGGDRQE
ncbi:MAG: hypothetical protein J5940_04525 [Clostridia bacterium]|nr:hypothetical protein [Clostridia bacterium]